MNMSEYSLVRVLVKAPVLQQPAAQEAHGLS